ncbi:hypothetical protein GTCCBUS3UF5_15540 [Geobacillus thermoleovorans CCB_US3_UF5]|uniref:Uncharacterized protein n=1 Tax=Geobacillus thermoleovorans CCB_US3_UF5 TaxID=1111068 RepID=A0ABM5MGU4_GEOTH|nr:hypothetical protein GTCCBUS3UF5_15540 [Geobacillus thermoleovorans CCB_US3_UF5]
MSSALIDAIFTEHWIDRRTTEQTPLSAPCMGLRSGWLFDRPSRQGVTEASKGLPSTVEKLISVFSVKEKIC